MKFHEKLNFLMNITNTNNSALGRKINLDPSYISRLRRGQRSAIKDGAVIYALASYLMSKSGLDYQQKALSAALNKNVLNLSHAELSALAAKWLTGEISGEKEVVKDFLKGFGSFTAGPYKAGKPPKTDADIKEPLKTPLNDMSVYYGIEGKRKAAKYFLAQAAAQNKPQTILLYSDESTDWMTENQRFAKMWASLMAKVISKGNRIKIIHTVSRDLDEMLSAIRQWMPLYMSGAIEPYYYPKKRDGIFKRTLFIAPGVSAVVSNSVAGADLNSANILFKDKSAITSFEEEFYQYLSLCKPLMQIFTQANKKTYLETLIDFEKEEGSSIMKTDSLSFLTMPEKVLRKILARASRENSYLVDYQRQRTEIFRSGLQKNTFTEIVPVFDFEQIKSGKIKLSFSDMMEGEPIYYKKEEYIEHLRHLIHLQSAYKNFGVKLIKESPSSSYTVYAKEDLGAIVAKTSAPSIVLAIRESNLSGAFWGYLKDTIGEGYYPNTNSGAEAEKLKKYIQMAQHS